MKRFRYFIPVLLLLTAACSPIEDTKNTLTYINGAEDYMNEMSQFTEDFPTMAEAALRDTQAAQELESYVQQIQQDIETFNKLESPAMMEELHSEILNHNENIQQGLKTFEQELENGTLNIEFIENSEVLKSVQDIQNIYEQIEQLGE